MFSAKELNLEESELRQQIALLTLQQRDLYLQMEKIALKKTTVYGALNCLFMFGAHHFYLRRWVRGALNLILTVVGLYLLSFLGERVYGVSLLLAVAIIEIPQMINAELLVHAYNIRAMRECLSRAGKSLP